MNENETMKIEAFEDAMKVVKAKTQFIHRIPLDWLEKCSKLPGKTVVVGNLIWYLAGVKQRKKDLILSNVLMERFGISLHAKYHALDAMEAAGLIEVQRTTGKNPSITLLTNLADKETPVARLPDGD